MFYQNLSLEIMLIQACSTLLLLFLRITVGNALLEGELGI